MTAVQARLDLAVPLRYTVHHTNTHQTLTALALICHQVNAYEPKIKNPPPGFDKWEIDMNDHKEKFEPGLEGRKRAMKATVGGPPLNINLMV